jgi:hypothetical protein
VSPSSAVHRARRNTSVEYEVHYIGVNWSHHIFVNQNFKVVGANEPPTVERLC